MRDENKITEYLFHGHFYIKFNGDKLEFIGILPDSQPTAIELEGKARTDENEEREKKHKRRNKSKAK